MIRAIIVDDERPSIKTIRRLLESIREVRVEATFDDAYEAIDFLETNRVDVVFLDIEMPQISGLELANMIHSNSKVEGKPRIVFITAYHQYALEAFTVNAIDYLLKPVKKDRLNLTLERLFEQLNIRITPTKLKVQCFKDFKIYAGDSIVTFRTQKATELIALLIDSKGEPVRRSKIMDLLWPDFDGDKALINLNTTVFYIRKALNDYGTPQSVIYKNGNYWMDMQEIEVDYFKFSDYKLENLVISDANIEEAIGILNLYKGDYLGDKDYHWSTIEALNQHERFVKLVMLTEAYYLGIGDTVESMNVLLDAYSKGCESEQVMYRLLQVLISEKKYALALKYYDAYKAEIKNQDSSKRFKELIEKMI